jgi:Fe-S cluster assembly ATPase SufC
MAITLQELAAEMGLSHEKQRKGGLHGVRLIKLLSKIWHEKCTENERVARANRDMRTALEKASQTDIEEYLKYHKERTYREIVEELSGGSWTVSKSMQLVRRDDLNWR